MAKHTKDKKVTTGVVFPEARLNLLRQEANEEETSVSNIVNIAVKEHQEKKEEDKKSNG